MLRSLWWWFEDQHVALQIEGRRAKILREDRLLSVTHVRMCRIAARTGVAQFHLTSGGATVAISLGSIIASEPKRKHHFWGGKGSPGYLKMCLGSQWTLEILEVKSGAILLQVAGGTRLQDFVRQKTLHFIAFQSLGGFHRPLQHKTNISVPFCAYIPSKIQSEFTMKSAWIHRSFITIESSNPMENGTISPSADHFPMGKKTQPVFVPPGH